MSDTGGPDVFLSEILGQPEALRRAGRAVVDQRDALERLRIVRAARARGPIVLTGMGSSLAACDAAATVMAGDGVLATPIDTAGLLHFRTPALGPTTLLCLVSQSGESAEVLRLVDELRRRVDRPFLLAITNGTANALAARVDLVLDTRVGSEEAPSTGSFAGALVMLAAVGRVLVGGGGPGDPLVERTCARVSADADLAASAAASLLADPESLADQMSVWLGGRPAVTIVGRGTARAAAEMAALTIKEAAAFQAEALETGAFRHGPIELAGPTLAVAILVLEEATAAIDRGLAAELVAAGTAVLLLDAVDGRSGPAVETIALASTERIDRMLVPAVALIPLQLLARRLAIERGRRPGEFTHATKVTARE